MALEITDENIKELINSGKPVVIDFWAEWCGPCRMLGPVMEELATDNAGKKVQIVKVNVDEQPELAGAFRIQSIPAVFFVQNGQMVHQVIGVNPK